LFAVIYGMPLRSRPRRQNGDESLDRRAATAHTHLHIEKFILYRGRSIIVESILGAGWLLTRAGMFAL
jgi:hypothetical protein